MSWLLCDGRVIASLEVASTRSEKRRGLLGRDGIEGALWLDGIRSVHTLGMRFDVDVAHLDADGQILRIVTMRRWRVGRRLRRAAHVVEAEAGSFGHWGLAVGDRLEIRG